MRLIEAVIDANHRAVSGDQKAGVHPKDFTDSLPLVALTCIDPRLNPLIPEVLGIPEDQFIWLRNAGNIITTATSSTIRSLALACTIKGGKEIAVIGHTDCRVRQTSVMELTERLRELGIDRSRLPEDIHEFFGLFASERQNVMRGVDFVRQSPVIGPRIPVHGLLIDIETGKVEWLINGYDVLEKSVGEQKAQAATAGKGPIPLDHLPSFKVGEMKFPDFKIGETLSTTIEAVTAALHPSTEAAASQPAQPQRGKERILKFAKSTLFKVVGVDKKIYGPVTGEELEQWLADTRINPNTLAQKVGYKEWRELASFAEHELEKAIPVAPPVLPGIHLRKQR